MEIKVLGTGCAKCKTVYAVVEKVVAEAGISATIVKVEDIMEIMKFNIIATPAVVVDGVVKIKGRVPTEAEVRQALGL
ncbi:thioredoxin family protein [Bacteroides sp.]|uniref:thioredoxin family protein n=1 Tax=Bacteroides sp. TaxID=29523 RepID=UPI001B3D85AF|nr:thioredoxin family protein [Bacteroides sp.]MBP6064692.1 TM0996/MTH895 family glutaredoxin-like protein [Bacteroides sp.]MBP6067166.1 TM0996/MTH895 family glutaredoxin-like protein [Bacteroides sp.]MBP6935917.1 TM0996/MTH895 family glutaredoxin-like protein [Bacteroides sp.]MBP8621923.1 TM0996/MTH895 family glutaredoxin-like protein [Bacteroides sp.]MBP9585428.1 TM0996/MTH895 family glutaredoxin-like protein [Bacteroides sp.]